MIGASWLWLGVGGVAVALVSLVALFIFVKNRKVTKPCERTDRYVFDELQGVSDAFKTTGIAVQPMSHSNEDFPNESLYPISLWSGKSYGSTPQLTSSTPQNFKIDKQISPRIKCLTAETSSSSPNLASSPEQSKQELVFSIVWTANDNNLLVNIIEVTSLPAKLKDAKISFIVTLRRFGTITGSSGCLDERTEQFGESPTSLQKKRKRKTSDFFVFSDVSVDVIHKSDLVFEMSIKRHLRSIRTKEITFPLRKLDLKPNSPIETRVLIDNIMSVGENPQEVGLLKLSIQKIDLTIKITILQVKLTSKISDDVRIVLNVLLNDEVVKQFSTLNQSATSLKWEAAAFSFNFCPSKSESYIIQASVMIATTKPKRFGEVNIGYESTFATGIDHWDTVLKSPGKVITRWHPIFVK